jgi:hypothetical protein
MTTKRRKKALQIARKLQDAGQHRTARRLVEAFQLEKQFGKGLDISTDESIAEIDDAELSEAVRDLERYIPTAAVQPEIQDEEDFGNTGLFHRRTTRRRR